MYNFVNVGVSIYHGQIFATDRYCSVFLIFHFPLLTFLNQCPANVSIVNFTSWKGERLKSYILGHRNRNWDIEKSWMFNETVKIAFKAAF